MFHVKHGSWIVNLRGVRDSGSWGNRVCACVGPQDSTRSPRRASANHPPPRPAALVVVVVVVDRRPPVV